MNKEEIIAALEALSARIWYLSNDVDNAIDTLRDIASAIQDASSELDDLMNEVSTLETPEAND